MLEAFFTRQRKRNLTILTFAIGLTVFIGGQNTVPVDGPQASQAVASSDVSDAPTASAPGVRPLKSVQPVAPQAETAPQPGASNTSVQSSSSSSTSTSTQSASTNNPTKTIATTTWSLTQGAIERQETTDGVTFTVHYGITASGSATPQITAKLTPDATCDKSTTTSTYALSTQADLTLSCTYTKTSLQPLPADLTFKLDVSDASGTSSSLTYRSTK